MMLLLHLGSMITSSEDACGAASATLATITTTTVVEYEDRENKRPQDIYIPAHAHDCFRAPCYKCVGKDSATGARV